MSKTKDIYGIYDKELYARIGRAVVVAEFSERLAVIEERIKDLNKEGTLESITNPALEEALSARTFWRTLLDNMDKEA